MIIMIGSQRLLKDRRIQKLGLADEFMILVLLYHLFCSTDFLLFDDAKDLVGRSMIVTTIFIIGVHITQLFINSMTMIYNKSRISYLKARQKSMIK